MRLTIRAPFLGSFGQERFDALCVEALRVLYFWYRNLPPTLFKVNNCRKLELAGRRAARNALRKSGNEEEVEKLGCMIFIQVTNILRT